MLYLITFDISENRVRYRAVKVLKGVGRRVQKSVFECGNLSEEKLLEVQGRLEKLIDHSTDSIRYYQLCRNCQGEVEWHGIGKPPDNEVFKVV